MKFVSLMKVLLDFYIAELCRVFNLNSNLRANGNLRVHFLISDSKFQVKDFLAFRPSVLKIRDMNPLSNGLFEDYEECRGYR